MKRLVFTGALLGAMAIAAVAIAAPFKFSGTAFDGTPRFMKGGFYSGSGSVVSTTNAVTNVLAQTFDYDFPSCTAGDTKQSTDKALTLTGVALGDPCFVGVTQATPADAGSAYSRDSIFIAVATKANTIELRQFCIGADAGIRDAPDAGYNVRCISNQ